LIDTDLIIAFFRFVDREAVRGGGTVQTAERWTLTPHTDTRILRTRGFHEQQETKVLHRLLPAAFMAVEQIKSEGIPGRPGTHASTVDGHGRGSLGRPAGRHRAHKDGDEDDGGPALLWSGRNAKATSSARPRPGRLLIPTPHMM
jgi:hypothetical protein